MNTIKRQSKTYANCITEIGGTDPVYKMFTKFTLLKSSRVKTLIFCCEPVFYFFIEMESFFGKYYEIMSPKNIDLKNLFLKKLDLLIVIIYEMK